MLVPSMPTSPSFWPCFPGCSVKARGLTFLARMCALHQRRQHTLSEHPQEHKLSCMMGPHDADAGLSLHRADCISAVPAPQAACAAQRAAEVL